LWNISNFLLIYWVASFGRIVETPLILSLSIAKIGDRAKPSNLLISLDEVTKRFLVLKKYQISGGIVIKIYGKAVIAVTKDPITTNELTKKSKKVLGRSSC
jgi:hypothetical protein